AGKEYQAIFTLEETDEVDVAPDLPENSIDEDVTPSLPVLEPLPVDDAIIAPTIPVEPTIEDEVIIDFSKVPDFEEDSYGPYPNMQGQYGSN
ncbi:hypothetical protein, partial [Psychrobacter sanguinis]|uniref:hypothetical protein n=1 Tax=Psychrobacter sanguinis TaxID=861445 RepID=UPI001396BAD6